MNTLWVFVVLSFASVCQPAPLVCDKLATQIENSPDLSGRWHYIAVSTKVCLPIVLLNSIIWPSVEVDIAPKETPKHYAVQVRAKLYGVCVNESEEYFYENSKIFGVNSENAPIGDPDVLLHTSCSDCIVVMDNDTTMSTLSLLSRRTAVSEAELKEFETQAQCNQFSKPQILNTDLDFNNCQDMGDLSDDQSLAFLSRMYERMKSSKQDVFNCLSNILQSYISS
ncbi:uncharacterized protein LOC119788658 [Cyprinodon tularosa]|uniref:uncharacterized protein LOC119788658 n=1 Tax=Cyprinodon tularosa TaxID=77115 RepID=UPI0018E26368|nr:uncharacterized protein LOC119788658 [Cyprinodon tularosa]